MFNLSFGELVIFAIIGLLVIGPKELPRIAKILGKTIGDLKRSLSEASQAVTKEVKSGEELKDVLQQKLSIEEVMKNKNEKS